LVAAVHCVAVGALKGAVVAGAIGAVTGGAKAAVKHRVKTGSWKGASTAVRDGAADGFMKGTISGAIAGGATSNVCFVAGTAVLTVLGFSDIEEIKVGDKVWSENPETGEKELKEVVQTFVNETEELVHVHVNGEELITTPEHPFYIPKKGWIGAIDLRAGDILVLQSGEYVVVELIQHEILETPVKVYNFEVEDFHTYYVGKSSVLVHNACGAHTEEQQIIVKWAKEYEKNGGINRDDAIALVDLAKEYGLNHHYPQIHSGRSGVWGHIEHIKIFKSHIPIIE
jgi:hypothetical protein